MDKITIEIRFDPPLGTGRAAENFVRELRNELLEGAQGGGPWGMGRACVADVQLVGEGS